MTDSFKNKIETMTQEIREQTSGILLDNFLIFLNTADILERYVDEEMRTVGINRTNLWLLNYLIVLGGRATPTKLSTRIFRSKHGITKAIDILEKEGLVRSEAAVGDRRVRMVVITSAGLEVVKNLTTFRREISSKVMSPLNKTDAKLFNSILKLLRRHILSIMKNKRASS